MRSLYVVRSVTGNPILAKIVNHDEKDIGFYDGLYLYTADKDKREEKYKTFHGIGLIYVYFQVFSLTGLPLVVRIWKW